MLKDYTKMPRNGSREPKKRSSKKPGLPTFLIILVIAGALYYAFSQGILILNAPKIASSLKPAPTAAPTPQPTRKEPEKPRFEFYTLLSKETVPLPNNKNASADVTTTTMPEEPKKTKKITPLPAPSGVPDVPVRKAATVAHAPEKMAPVTESKPASKPASKQTGYALQVAALQKISEAEAMKAQLTLLGFPVVIEPFQHNGTTWYRVKAGPYSSLAEAQKARQALNSHHLGSLLVRL